MCPSRKLIAVLSMSIVGLALAVPARAGVDLNEDDFRLYCGYLDELAKPEMQKLKGPARDKKIATRAKVKPSALVASVARGEKVGATCSEVGKKVGADAKAAVQAAFPSRVLVFNFDDSDPSHVVAQVTWLGVEKAKLVEEAALLAATLAVEAPIVKTIAIRAVDPAAPDKTADDAAWFEAKITRLNATHIQKDKIADYAETRYLRLFDGVIRK